MMKITTFRLNNGRDVLARVGEDGETWPFSFSNRTQAYKRQAEQGEEWEVIRPGRPFYVARKVA